MRKDDRHNTTKMKKERNREKLSEEGKKKKTNCRKKEIKETERGQRVKNKTVYGMIQPHRTAEEEISLFIFLLMGCCLCRAAGGHTATTPPTRTHTPSLIHHCNCPTGNRLCVNAVRKRRAGMTEEPIRETHNLFV